MPLGVGIGQSRVEFAGGQIVVCRIQVAPLATNPLQLHHYLLRVRLCHHVVDVDSPVTAFVVYLLSYHNKKRFLTDIVGNRLYCGIINPQKEMRLLVQ